jgi:hypothetical protein
MNSKAVWTSVVTFLLLTVLLAIVAPAANAQAKHVRWDIISVNFGTGVISAGGSASAFAGFVSDVSEITLTGTGTFVAPANGGGSDTVTGGGTWTIDTPSASGTYEVKGLVRFDESPGTLVGSGLTDKIGDIEDAVAGLAVLTIQYSDGDRGILVVSCNITGASIFEGVTASKGPVDYRKSEAPEFFGTTGENLTAFHIAD